jgi:hypothetical protein
MRAYLDKKVNPVFERLIIDLLADMPDNFVIYYILTYLDRFLYRMAKN